MLLFLSVYVYIYRCTHTHINTYIKMNILAIKVKKN